MEVFLSTYNIKIMRKPISIRLNGHNKPWIICWHVLSIFENIAIIMSDLQTE